MKLCGCLLVHVSRGVGNGSRGSGCVTDIRGIVGVWYSDGAGEEENVGGSGE
jgi:hypothetical protein